jgi:ABC-type glycerol-3-phosphate transport system permease component
MFNNILFFLILLVVTALFLLPTARVIATPTTRDFIRLIITDMELPMLFPRYFINSVLVTTAVTLLQLWLATPAGYALAKVKFPGSRLLNGMVELGLLFGGGLFVTQYVVLNKLGLINTFPALILPLASTSLGVFLIREFSRGIHDDIINAAKLDGASHRVICRDIIIPNIKPARVTLGLFAVNSAWQAGSGNFVYGEEWRVMADVTGRIGTAYAEITGITAALTIIMMAFPVAALALYRGSAEETMTYGGLK